MANTFANHRPAPHNRCFGIEIECMLANDPAKPVPLYTVEGEVYFGRDGSINGVPAGFAARELVTQPLEFEPMMEAIAGLEKWQQRTNASCGIHVHVGRGVCSTEKARVIARQLGLLQPRQILLLFGRGPCHYCQNTGLVGYHCALMNHELKGTTEFRLFASGTFEWARECVRRVKIMCEMEENRTYDNLKRAFGIVEEEGILRP